MKKYLLQALISGILASGAGVIYYHIYSSQMWVDFSTVLNETGIVSSTFFAMILLAFASYFTRKIKYSTVIINSLLVIVTFVSLLGPLSFTLPLDIDSPEMFVGLAMPLHLIPALFWFFTASFFKK